MRNTLKRIALGTALTVSLLAANQNANASEPENNTPPFGYYFGNAEFYQSNEANTSGWGGGGINITKGDNDYVVLSCAGLRPVKHVGITIDNASVDLDIRVYDMNGTYLGGSFGTGTTEIVTVKPFGKQSVVMQVYGYNNAYGSYSADVYCQD
jgi:hypothetical protein